MKNIKIFFGTCIIATVLFTGCAQTSSKQKELELKERELALKEKEFALKEKGLLIADSLVQKKAIVPNQKSIESKEKVEIKLVVNSQNEGGGPGQIAFTKKDKTLLWYEKKSQKGIIVINGTKYIINNCSNDETSYSLSGPDLKIKAFNVKQRPGSEGADCVESICSKIVIQLKGVSTSIEHVDIGDCLSFSF
ncbi:MAG: hypothetical protein M0R39_07525 [Prolixibacteraceae bacterium]|nr:hypothetical protein [Prolixibacteraceae bacterium]